LPAKDYESGYAFETNPTVYRSMHCVKIIDKPLKLDSVAGTRPISHFSNISEILRLLTHLNTCIRLRTRLTIIGAGVRRAPRSRLAREGGR